MHHLLYLVIFLTFCFSYVFAGYDCSDVSLTQHKLRTSSINWANKIRVHHLMKEGIFKKCQKGKCLVDKDSIKALSKYKLQNSDNNGDRTQNSIKLESINELDLATKAAKKLCTMAQKNVCNTVYLESQNDLSKVVKYPKNGMGVIYDKFHFSSTGKLLSWETQLANGEGEITSFQ